MTSSPALQAGASGRTLLRSLDFEVLPPEAKADVYMWEDVMKAIDAASNKSDAIRQIEARMMRQPGFKFNPLRMKHHKWVKGGRDWRVLHNHAKYPIKEVVAPSARKLFGNIFKTYCERNQRAAAPAWEQMMFDLRRGVLFEGGLDWRALWKMEHPHGAPPVECPHDYIPRGMGYRNMMLYCKLTPFEKAVTRIGTKAASAFVPHVYTTRVGLLPGQLYMTDDVWDDIEIAVPGVSRAIARPVSLVSMDAASTFLMAKQTRARYKKEDGTFDSIKELEMLHHVWNVLCNYGFHKDGMIWILEHGTAALKEWVQELVTKMTGDRVTFRHSGFLGKALHKGVFDYAGGGNFRIKAMLEGIFKLYHYRMGSLPGQTGGNARKDRPEQLEGLERYASGILKKAEGMELAARERLLYGALTWRGYGERVDNILHAINSRHEHDIEGFVDNGWMEKEISLDGKTGWKSVSEITYLPTENARNAALDLMNTPGHNRFRKWSPLEVWENHQDNLERLPLWCGVQILGMENVKKVTVKSNHLIEFQDQWYGTEPLRYEGWVATPAQERMILAPGREYGIFVNINDISRAVIVELPKGDILGIARQWKSVMPLDQEEIATRQALQARAAKALAAPVIERHADEADDRLAAMAHNETIISEGARHAPPLKRKNKPPSRDVYKVLAGTLTTTQEVQDEQWQ